MPSSRPLIVSRVFEQNPRRHRLGPVAVDVGHVVADGEHDEALVLVEGAQCTGEPHLWPREHGRNDPLLDFFAAVLGAQKLLDVPTVAMLADAMG
jgi:hypothetical protein